MRSLARVLGFRSDTSLTQSVICGAGFVTRDRSFRRSLRVTFISFSRRQCYYVPGEKRERGRVAQVGMHSYRFTCSNDATHFIMRRHTFHHACMRRISSCAYFQRNNLPDQRVIVHTSSVFLPWPPHSPPLFAPEAHRAKDGISALCRRTEEKQWRQRE